MIHLSAQQCYVLFGTKPYSGSAAYPAFKPTTVLQADEQSGMSISLPRVNSAELLLFPETAEGHVSKV